MTSDNAIGLGFALLLSVIIVPVAIVSFFNWRERRHNRRMGRRRTDKIQL